MSLLEADYIKTMMAKPLHQGHSFVGIADATDIKREKIH